MLEVRFSTLTRQRWLPIRRGRRPAWPSPFLPAPRASCRGGASCFQRYSQGTAWPLARAGRRTRPRRPIAVVRELNRCNAEEGVGPRDSMELAHRIGSFKSHSPQIGFGFPDFTFLRTSSFFYCVCKNLHLARIKHFQGQVVQKHVICKFHGGK